MVFFKRFSLVVGDLVVCKVLWGVKFVVVNKFNNWGFV